MAGLTDNAEIDILKLITGQATTIWTSTPVTCYIGLQTTAPTESTSGTEVSGGSYARVTGASKFGTPAAGSVASNAVITFPTATADWGSVVSFGLYDASTAGNLLGWGTVTKTIQNGDTASFASGALTITAD